MKNADSEISERSTRLLSNCLQIATQLQIFSQIEGQLDATERKVQTDVLEILTLKLGYADAKFKGFIRSPPPSTDTRRSQKQPLLKRERAIYAWEKSSLDKAIAEVESWQRLSFNPLWFASMKAQPQNIEKELSQDIRGSAGNDGSVKVAALSVRNPLKNIATTRIFLPPEKLESGESIEIAHGSVRLVHIDSKMRLVETLDGLSKDTVRELAVRLKKTDPSTFGLLTCLGAVQHQKKDSFSIIFRVPDNKSDLASLRARILENDTAHSLSDRFRLATQLARAVSSIHTFDMVHKSIRPENIVLFPDSESTLGSAFLVGFENVRREGDKTGLTGDCDWAKNLYRHPQRQGASLRDRYIMQHDIYSLGVCLLEIGLWTTFVGYDANHAPIKSQAHGLQAAMSHEQAGPESVKAHLLSLATTELEHRMGTKYSRVVVSCLTCLDLGNDDFGDEFELETEKVDIGTRYIEKVKF